MSRVDDLADALRGTCRSLEAAQEELGIEDMTTEEYHDLDSKVLQCAVCSWWEDADEMVLDYSETEYRHRDCS